jgi:4-aminobutyrate--pyruvate transaminase
MITCAKAIAAGLQPISALLVNEKVYRALTAQSVKLGNLGHGFTYSGHPVAAAVALETLRIYEETDMLAHITSLGPHLQQSVGHLSDHRMVGNVRGVGMIAGIEFVADKKKRQPFDSKLAVGSMVGEQASEEGLIVRVIGDVIAIAPSLTVSTNDVDDIARRLTRAIDAVSQRLLT